MLPGDLLSFSGKGFIPTVIKLKTWSRVSHVGIVVFPGWMIEATTLGDRSGVFMSRINERTSNYNGRTWLQKLKLEYRLKADIHAMQRFLVAQDGKRYDIFQAICSALIWRNKEDFRQLFCSELVAAGLEKAGIWSGNCSEMTPVDITRLDCYSEPLGIS